MPKVSVVMPVYNGEKYLKEAIDSILNQTFTDFEFVIVNDGSKDNSAQIIQSIQDKRIKFIQHQTNLGLVAALNTGIDASTGEYIARMDCDDIADSSRLEDQVKFMDSNPEVGLCGTWFRISTTGEEIKHPTDDAGIRIKLLSDTAFAHPTVMMRSEVLKKYKLKYNPEYKQGEDYGMWIDIARVSKLANVPEVLLTYRMHESQLTQKYVEDFRHFNNVHRLALLEDLKLKPSEFETKVHLSLVTKQPAGLRLKDYNAWIEKLLSANSEINFFDQSLLKKFLAEGWQFMILSNRIYSPSNLIPFFFSKVKGKYGELSLEFQIKFIVKSLISWTRIRSH